MRLVLAAIGILCVSCSTTYNSKVLNQNGTELKDDFVDDVDINQINGDFDDLYRGQNKIKKVGVLSTHVQALVDGNDKKIRFIFGGTETTTTSVTLGVANFQYVADKAHDSLVAALRKKGFEVIPSEEIIKLPSYRKVGSDQSRAGKGWTGNIHAVAKGGNDYSTATLPLMQDDEWMDSLAKEAGVDGFVMVDAFVAMKLADTDSKDDVQGAFFLNDQAMKVTWCVPHYRFKAAGGSSGFVDANHCAIVTGPDFAFESFFPVNYKTNDQKAVQMSSLAWDSFANEVNSQMILMAEKSSNELFKED